LADAASVSWLIFNSNKPTA